MPEKERAEKVIREAPSCANYETCGLYTKILPVLDEHVDDHEQRKILEQLFDACKNEGTLGNCDLYKTEVCEKYPGCSTIKGRLNPMLSSYLMETSINVCLFREGKCMDDLDVLAGKLNKLVE